MAETNDKEYRRVVRCVSVMIAAVAAWAVVFFLIQPIDGRHSFAFFAGIAGLIAGAIVAAFPIKSPGTTVLAAATTGALAGPILAWPLFLLVAWLTNAPL